MSDVEITITGDPEQMKWPEFEAVDLITDGRYIASLKGPVMTSTTSQTPRQSSIKKAARLITKVFQLALKEVL